MGRASVAIRARITERAHADPADEHGAGVKRREGDRGPEIRLAQDQETGSPMMRRWPRNGEPPARARARGPGRPPASEMVETLAISEGWNCTPPIPSHDLLELTTRP